MIYLIEFEAYDPAVPGVVTDRFATDGYTTRSGDTPANIHFEERIIHPGKYDRSVFGNGRTSGESVVGAGYIELAIVDVDPEQGLDRLTRYAVDGRPLRIYSLESTSSPWSSRSTVFVGTMEQIEFGWTKATIRIRDRLAELKKPIQPTLYAGTTTAGGMNEAEGTAEDLKDRPKPMLWGKARNIPAVLANRFDRIYQVSSGVLSGIQAVRDRGVALSAGTNHASITALRTATIAGGQVHTCLAAGVLRVAATPAGDLTVDAKEGATGQRSAPKVVRRILEASGFVAGVDFSAADLDALHALNSAEVGIWIGPDTRDLLSVVMALLDSIGAYVVPDKLGVFRFGRIDAPSGTGPLLDRSVILDRGEGIERQVTGDDGKGVPSHKVTQAFARNYLVQPASSLDNTNVPADVKSFVSLETRSAVAEDPAVKTVYLLSPEMTFDSLLADASAAAAEATRRLGIYGVRRDRYRVPVKSEIAADIDLGDVVTLKLPRFDLAAGKPFVVIGIAEDLFEGVTTLDIYG